MNVPGFSHVAKLAAQRLREVVNDGMVESQCKCEFAYGSQRNIIARHVYLAKSIVFLKVTQAVFLFSTAAKIGVYEVGNTSFGAGSNCLRYQCIGWSLVSVLHHGNDMHHACLTLRLIECQFYEAD